MERNIKFPDVWGAIAILLLIFGLQIIAGIILFSSGITFEAGDPKYSGIFAALSFGAAIVMLMNYKKIGYTNLFNHTSTSVRKVMILASGPILFACGSAVFWLPESVNIVVQIAPMSEGR